MMVRDSNWNRDIKTSQKLIIELISKMEVVKILPYRVGVVEDKVDYYLDCNMTPDGLNELIKLHKDLAGNKIDNHQIIILKGAILRFSDSCVYIYMNATRVDENKSM